MGIHPTAIIAEGAHVHGSANVGPYSIIESDTIIGPDCAIESCVRVHSGTRMGRGNRICHGATLGSEPQDLTYKPELAKPLTIGDHNHFKEYVNISHGIKSEEGTRVGHDNYLMAYSHVGHDCVVGDHNIFANSATLAGHVQMEHHIFLSGQVAVHQFCRIGAYSMIAGVSGVPQDVPPFVTADGHRAKIVGVNTVGLRRNGFTREQRNIIQGVYRILFRSGLQLSTALARAAETYPSPETQQIIDFIRSARRGVISFA